MVGVLQHLGRYRSGNLHTWSVFWQLAHMVGVPQHMGWGGVMLPFLQLAHMVDVPQHMGWGRVMLPFWQLAHMHGRCSATHGVGGG